MIDIVEVRLGSLIVTLTQSDSLLLTLQPILTHPLLQATYTGVRTTVLGNIFFLPFLAETKREPPFPGHIHGSFWPHSFHFALF